MIEPFVFNHQVVLDRMGGDQEILDMMVEAFLMDAENNCQKFEAAWASGVLSEIAREAHTIKGLLATISDDAGAAEALVLEHAAKQGSIEGQDALAKIVVARMREVIASLSQGY